ncbi:MAG TPA: hypothetical protein VGK34_03825, partial [Armatimonadota bacterium]
MHAEYIDAEIISATGNASIHLPKVSCLYSRKSCIGLTVNEVMTHNANIDRIPHMAETSKRRDTV